MSRREYKDCGDGRKILDTTQKCICLNRKVKLDSRGKVFFVNDKMGQVVKCLFGLVMA